MKTYTVVLKIQTSETISPTEANKIINSELQRLNARLEDNYPANTGSATINVTGINILQPMFTLQELENCLNGLRAESLLEFIFGMAPKLNTN